MSRQATLLLLTAGLLILATLIQPHSNQVMQSAIEQMNRNNMRGNEYTYHVPTN